ncbi:hypothetical protein KIPB_002099 [Kipferlia bialata]|uniref:Ubiquitin-like protease family profile domain-containing protein n=1 Tax=Kipferlia bialata TaxID=797122 RepID=A0A9K3CNA1_9EUKA|nr:hypothetical protein KIPB_000262 [Kipferlia bialata]GIQ81182.1 hypothetical protein KIPB_002099 [Kipferlia bialata]|eukprot:g262.t1
MTEPYRPSQARRHIGTVRRDESQSSVEVVGESGPTFTARRSRTSQRRCSKSNAANNSRGFMHAAMEAEGDGTGIYVPGAQGDRDGSRWTRRRKGAGNGVGLVKTRATSRGERAASVKAQERVEAALVDSGERPHDSIGWESTAGWDALAEQCDGDLKDGTGDDAFSQVSTAAPPLTPVAGNEWGTHMQAGAIDPDPDTVPVSQLSDMDLISQSPSQSPRVSTRDSPRASSLDQPGYKEMTLTEVCGSTLGGTDYTSVMSHGLDSFPKGSLVLSTQSEAEAEAEGGGGGEGDGEPLEAGVAVEDPVTMARGVRFKGGPVPDPLTRGVSAIGPCHVDGYEGVSGQSVAGIFIEGAMGQPSKKPRNMSYKKKHGISALPPGTPSTPCVDSPTGGPVSPPSKRPGAVSPSPSLSPLLSGRQGKAVTGIRTPHLCAEASPVNETPRGRGTPRGRDRPSAINSHRAAPREKAPGREAADLFSEEEQEREESSSESDSEPQRRSCRARKKTPVKMHSTPVSRYGRRTASVSKSVKKLGSSAKSIADFDDLNAASSPTPAVQKRTPRGAPPMWGAVITSEDTYMSPIHTPGGPRNTPTKPKGGPRRRRGSVLGRGEHVGGGHWGGRSGKSKGQMFIGRPKWWSVEGCREAVEKKLVRASWQDASLLLVPVCHDVHWTLAIISNPRAKDHAPKGREGAEAPVPAGVSTTREDKEGASDGGALGQGEAVPEGVSEAQPSDAHPEVETGGEGGAVGEGDVSPSDSVSDCHLLAQRLGECVLWVDSVDSPPPVHVLESVRLLADIVFHPREEVEAKRRARRERAEKKLAAAKAQTETATETETEAKEETDSLISLAPVETSEQIGTVAPVATGQSEVAVPDEKASAVPSTEVPAVQSSEEKGREADGGQPQPPTLGTTPDADVTLAPLDQCTPEESTSPSISPSPSAPSPLPTDTGSGDVLMEGVQSEGEHMVEGEAATEAEAESLPATSVPPVPSLPTESIHSESIPSESIASETTLPPDSIAIRLPESSLPTDADSDAAGVAVLQDIPPSNPVLPTSPVKDHSASSASSDDPHTHQPPTILYPAGSVSYSMPDCTSPYAASKGPGVVAQPLRLSPEQSASLEPGAEAEGTPAILCEGGEADDADESESTDLVEEPPEEEASAGDAIEEDVSTASGAEGAEGESSSEPSISPSPSPLASTPEEEGGVALPVPETVKPVETAQDSVNNSVSVKSAGVAEREETEACAERASPADLAMVPSGEGDAVEESTEPSISPSPPPPPPETSTAEAEAETVAETKADTGDEPEAAADAPPNKSDGDGVERLPTAETPEAIAGAVGNSEVPAAEGVQCTGVEGDTPMGDTPMADEEIPSGDIPMDGGAGEGEKEELGGETGEQDGAATPSTPEPMPRPLPGSDLSPLPLALVKACALDGMPDMHQVYGHEETAEAESIVPRQKKPRDVLHANNVAPAFAIRAPIQDNAVDCGMVVITCGYMIMRGHPPPGFVPLRSSEPTFPTRKDLMSLRGDPLPAYGRGCFKCKALPYASWRQWFKMPFVRQMRYLLVLETAMLVDAGVDPAVDRQEMVPMAHDLDESEVDFEILE